MKRCDVGRVDSQVETGQGENTRKNFVEGLGKVGEWGEGKRQWRYK